MARVKHAPRPRRTRTESNGDALPVELVELCDKFGDDSPRLQRWFTALLTGRDAATSEPQPETKSRST
jgi:hypothetical protein